MISPKDIITDRSINIQSVQREFKSLYKPIGKDYLRGLDSYEYNKNRVMSTADYMKKFNINPLGVQANTVQLKLPKNASDAQIMEYNLRVVEPQLIRPAITPSVTPPDYRAGWSSNAINRSEVVRTNIGLIYSDAAITKNRTQNIIPEYSLERRRI